MLTGKFLGRWSWRAMDFVLDEEMVRVMLDFKTRYEGSTGRIDADQLGMVIHPRQ